MSEKKLTDEELKQISGGDGYDFRGTSQIKPSSYLYSVVITRDGVQCLKRVEWGYVDVLCYIKAGTTIYVLSDESLNYVKCTFTQDGQTFTGYVSEQDISDYRI